MDQLAGGAAEAAAADADRLVGEALYVELNPPFPLVVERDMGEAVDIEIAAELVLDPVQQVQIEGGVEAGAVVVGGVEDVGRFLQIGADQHLAAGAEQPGAVLQKRDDAV